MANYAVIENQIVVNVVVAESDYASRFENWIEIPDKFGIDDTYDNERKMFIKRKIFPSWILDEQTGFWNPPTPRPDDYGVGNPPKNYRWDEETLSWMEVQNGS